MAKNKNENMSATQRKRLEREKARAKARREQNAGVVTGIIILAAIVISIGFVVGNQIRKSINKVEPGSDYSALLTEEGFIQDVVASNCVDLPGYKMLTVSRSELEYSDEDVDADIAATMANYAEVDTETTDPVQDGDRVSIEYIGYVNGEAFEGGNTMGSPTELEIGSGSYIDDFEEQLIGDQVGDHVTVHVTFPEGYGDEMLDGQDAVFEVDIDGIYVTPEFTDAFIEENFPEFATTTAEYRQYLKDQKFQENLRNWVENTLVSDSAVREYPKAYLKNLKSTTKYDEQAGYEQMNAYYMEYYGELPYTSFEEYTGMSESEYDISLNDTCKEMEKKDLVFQAILEKENVRVTEADYRAYVTETTGSDESVDQMIETYGVGYAVKNMVMEKAIQIVMDNITIQ